MSRTKMRNLSFASFRRSAQQQPKVNIPVRSFLALQQDETNRKLDGMRRLARDEKERDTENIKHVEANAAKVKSVRAEQFNMNTQFQQAYLEAEKQILRTRVNDARQQAEWARVRGARDSAAKQQLLKLIPKAMQAAGNALEMRDKLATDAANKFMIEYGVTAEQLAYERNLNAQTSVTSSALLSVEQKNAHSMSLEARKAFRNMSGYRKLKIEQLALAQYKDVLPSIFKEFETISPGGGLKSLSEIAQSEELGRTDAAATWRHNKTKVYELLRRDRKDGGYGLGSFDEGFLATQLRPYVHQIEQEWMAGQAERDGQNFGRSEHRAFKNELLGALNQQGGIDIGGGFVEWVNAGGTTSAEKKERLELGIRLLKEGVQRGPLLANGGIPAYFVDEIKDAVITLGDGSDEKNTQTIRKLWGEGSKHNLFAEVDQVIEDRTKKEIELAESNQVQGSNDTYMTVLSHRLNTGVIMDQESQDSLKAQMTYSGLKWASHPAFEWFKSYETIKTLDPAASKEILDTRASNGTLTTTELGKPYYTADDIKSHKDAVVNGWQSLDTRTRNTFLNSVKNKILTKSNDSIKDKLWKSDNLIMVAKAEKDLKKTYHDLRHEFTPDKNHERAEEAARRVNSFIDEGIAGYGRTGGLFGSWDYTGKRNIQSRANIAVADLKENRNHYFIAGNASEELRQDIAAMTETRKIPPEIHAADSHFPYMDPYMIAAHVIEKNQAAGTPGWEGMQFPTPHGIEKATAYVYPEMRRKLCNRPSYSKTVECIKLAAEKSGKTDAESEAIKNKTTGDPEMEGNEDSIYTEEGITTGKAKFNKPITEMTGDEVYQLFVNNQIVGKAGYYGWTGPEVDWLNSNGYLENMDWNSQALANTHLTMDKCAVGRTSDGTACYGHPEHIGEKEQYDVNLLGSFVLRFPVKWNELTPAAKAKIYEAFSGGTKR